MEIRDATEGDVSILAEMNHQLIRDEKHENPMNLAQLGEGGDRGSDQPNGQN